PVPIERPVTLPADFPLVEKRAPIGLAVLTVLLVFAAGYGVWQYLPRQQTVISEKVPPVPDRLMASPAPAAQPAAAAEAAASAPVPAPAPAAPPAQEVRGPSAPPSPAAEMWPAPKQEPAAQSASAPIALPPPMPASPV